MAARAAFLCCLLLVPPVALTGDESTCYGKVGNGRLENGRKLPPSGANFEPYSALGTTLGRTYVHSKVERVVLEAYQTLASTMPGVRFVYGETGWARGGRIAAHLYELAQAARRNGIGLTQVIFDTRYLQKLFAAPRGEWLKANLHFMPREPWIRHDEHYHVDFAVACEPL